MTRDEFIALLTRLAEESPIGVHEQIEMMEGSKPLLDADGNRVINDVVEVGDGRLYIERDGNEWEAEQEIIDLLNNIDEYLPDIIAALEAWWKSPSIEDVDLLKALAEGCRLVPGNGEYMLVRDFVQVGRASSERVNALYRAGYIDADKKLTPSSHAAADDDAPGGSEGA